MKGVKELEQYRKDHVPLSPKRAIKAFCADCMGLFEDKIKDCNNANCPLYPHMPYAKKKKNGVVLEKRQITDAKDEDDD